VLAHGGAVCTSHAAVRPPGDTSRRGALAVLFLLAYSVSFRALQKSLEACVGGSGTHAVLLGVWEELRQAIGAWLDVRQRPQLQQTAALQVGSGSRVAPPMRPDSTAMSQTPYHCRV
jgi:hypothetical protein